MSCFRNTLARPSIGTTFSISITSSPATTGRTSGRRPDMSGARYVPDEEARSLAWANARQNGARQQFNPIRDVEVVREIHRRYDDPLGIDSEPSLTDERIEAAKRVSDATLI